MAQTVGIVMESVVVFVVGSDVDFAGGSVVSAELSRSVSSSGTTTAKKKGSLAP